MSALATIAEPVPSPRSRVAGYGPIVGLVVYIATFLYVDHRLPSIGAQAAMGVATFGILLLAGFTLTADDRRQLCLLLIFATALELVSSQVWGVYRYRFGNVPFYIPPGHGVVFVLALWLARTPFLRRHEERATRLALIAAGAWAIGGVTVLPPLTGRVDLAGLLLWPIFCFFVLRTDRALFFAAMFLVTSLVEIYGVALGDWTWTPVAPHLRIPQGNPPSVIAGAYSVLDASVFVTLSAAAAMITRRRGRGRATPERAGEIRSQPRILE
jgi:hypothetical protein